jgi:threonine dehydrogenase-like Zn-dependent dehydrogenase
VRVTAACICGSDLWPYDFMAPIDQPARMGHEFIGIVEDTGPEVTTVARGDLVVSPFAISDGSCEFCREGLQTSCAHPQADFWDQQPLEGVQADAIRVTLADGTLVKLPVAPDAALIPSLLTLSDVYGTGHHAAVVGGVSRGTRVTVIGDGAVGLLPAYRQALGTVRPGGTISRVGVPSTRTRRSAGTASSGTTSGWPAARRRSARTSRS